MVDDGYGTPKDCSDMDQATDETIKRNAVTPLTREALLKLTDGQDTLTPNGWQMIRDSDAAIRKKVEYWVAKELEAWNKLRVANNALDALQADLARMTVNWRQEKAHGLEIQHNHDRLLVASESVRQENVSLRLRIQAVDAEHADMERQKHLSIAAFQHIEQQLAQVERERLEVEQDYQAAQHLADATSTEWKALKQQLAASEQRVKEEAAIVDRVWRALGITTYEQANGKSVDELVANLKARVQALEEALMEIVATDQSEFAKSIESNDTLKMLAKALALFNTARDRAQHALAPAQGKETP